MKNSKAVQFVADFTMRSFRGDQYTPLVFTFKESLHCIQVYSNEIEIKVD